MVDPRIALWARTMIHYSVEVGRGDVVAITGGVAAEPLLRALYREALARGGKPYLLPTLSGLPAELLALGSDEQIAYLSPLERFAREQADVVVSVAAETNTRASAGIDPARQRVFQSARGELSALFMKRAAQGSVRWSSTLFPTDAYAQDAEMSSFDFAEFIFAACKLNQPDPAAAWRVLHTEQQRLIDWLADKSEVRMTAPGTDLTLSVRGRTWINSDGHRNFPSGEIFTGPVEDSASGEIRFDYPVVTAGREISGIRLRFERGRVVEASAEKNETYLQSALDTDEGARFLGEFAFGTNSDIQRFTRTILLDEKIGGTVHVALGAGYPDSGSTNRSAIHWDLICDLRRGGLVSVDGIPFLRDGRFLV